MTLIVDGTTGVTFNDSSLQGAAASPYVLKNRIINGDMRIDQRNAGASVTPANGQYTLDRWRAAATVTSKFSVQQSSTAPTGFVNSLLVTSLDTTTTTGTNNYAIQQFIEGFNTSDLGWGTANAQNVTLSFWTRSSLTGTFGGAIQNNGQDRSYPFSYTISSANTWEYKTITISGDTTGTWLTTNGIGMRVFFGLGAGSSVSGTAGAWASGDYRNVTGATSVVGTNGATFYITGVQLEIGTSATPFERRLYGNELALCQRYYERVVGESSVQLLADTYSTGSTPVPNINIFYKQTKRAVPTISTVGTFYTSNTSGGQTHSIGTTSFNVYYVAAGAGRSYWHNDANSGWAISAEL